MTPSAKIINSFSPIKPDSGTSKSADVHAQPCHALNHQNMNIIISAAQEAIKSNAEQSQLQSRLRTHTQYLTASITSHNLRLQTPASTLRLINTHHHSHTSTQPQHPDHEHLPSHSLKPQTPEPLLSFPHLHHSG